MRPVDPPLSPQPLSLSRTRTRTQLKQQTTRTKQGKERRDPIFSTSPPASEPGTKQHARSSSAQHQQHGQRRAQTLDTRDKGNHSGPSPLNPGESCA
jgi:hypothetical protein